MVSALGDLLKLLTEATLLEEVEVDGFVGTLVMASLVLDGTLKLEREALDRFRKVLEHHRERVAILLWSGLRLLHNDRTIPRVNSLIRCLCLGELVFERITESCLSHSVQDRLLEVQVKAILDNKAAFLKRLDGHFEVLSLNDTSSLNISLRAQYALQKLRVSLLWVQVELADCHVFELFRGPPGVRHTLEQWPGAHRYLFWHLVNACLACHAQGHV